MSEVIYSLKHPFEYAFKGEMKSACFISLSAPGAKQLDKYAPIKQAFAAAISDIQEPAVKTEAAMKSTEITPNEAIAVLYQGKGDIVKTMVHAKLLFTSGVALVDGEERLSVPLWDDLTVDDIEGLLGTYLSAFTIPSLLGGR